METAYLSIFPGNQGVDSLDFARTLWNMYSTWAHSKGYVIELVHVSLDKDGLHNGKCKIMGEAILSKLVGETGAHRLVRFSPFDPAKRRTTCFASVVISDQHDGIEKDAANSGGEDTVIIKREHATHSYTEKCVRSYVLDPYTLVTDHRTDKKEPDSARVLSGWLDPFIP